MQHWKHIGLNHSYHTDVKYQTEVDLCIAATLFYDSFLSNE